MFIEVCSAIKGDYPSNENTNCTITVVKFSAMLLIFSLQMGSFHDEFHYKWGAFMMNFTTNGELS